jgi:hypothetical protein
MYILAVESSCITLQLRLLALSVLFFFFFFFFFFFSPFIPSPQLSRKRP